MALRVSPQDLRRYVLGKQGLWPGRRWKGHDGVDSALRAAEAVQVDPLNVIARNHDIALHARVEEYRPDILQTLLYEERRFFDYGGVVFIVPMEELKYFRTPMERRKSDQRWQQFTAESADVIRAVYADVERRGPLAARDLTATSRTAATFRSGRNTSVALYYLWMTGELMTHSRRGFERVYDLRGRIAPAGQDGEVATDEAEAFFARKALDFLGVASARGWLSWFCHFSQRAVSRQEARQLLGDLVGRGIAVPVQIDGNSEDHFVSAAGAALLDTVQGGQIPDEWRPANPTRAEQAALLAPLDIVSASGRARQLFDFEYVWEVYKPAAKRRWGYYTLPVRYGDRLVARIDPRFDKADRTLIINGLWLEDPSTGQDEDFHQQLGDELVRLSQLVGADRHDLSAVRPRAFARSLGRAIRRGTAKPAAGLVTIEHGVRAVRSRDGAGASHR